MQKNQYSNFDAPEWVPTWVLCTTYATMAQCLSRIAEKRLDKKSKYYETKKKAIEREIELRKKEEEIKQKRRTMNTLLVAGASVALLGIGAVIYFVSTRQQKVTI